MASKTKEKIIAKAITLFNKNGVMNVRLQHIADACGISVGNLAYHFQEHSLLVAEAIAKSVEELASDLKSWEAVQGLMDVDNVLIQLHDRMGKRSFIFSDLLEIKRNFKLEFESVKGFQNKFENKIVKCLGTFQEKGLVANQLTAADFDKLMDALFIYVLNYSRDKQLNGFKFDELEFRQKVWQLLYSSLSENGKAEFDILINPIFI